MSTVHLFAPSLFSKWGFNDGGLLLDWLFDYADDADVDRLSKSDYHRALRKLVREHLAPLLPGEFELCDIETSHNPIRVRTWHGQEWDDYADDAPPEVEHIVAEVPGELVLAALADFT